MDVDDRAKLAFGQPKRGDKVSDVRTGGILHVIYET